MTDKSLLRVLSGETLSVPPIWLMRQAGRYLPEYRAIRATASNFMEFCFSPKLAAEATLQPIRRFGFDAAIVFSDILVVPHALGQTVTFVAGEGPRLAPIEDPAGIEGLSANINEGMLSATFETLSRVKGELPPHVALIGFCGAPWTVASYMIAGRGTPDQAPARLFAYRYPEAFARLIDRLTDASIDYLSGQAAAGAEVLQIFDSWAGVLTEMEFDRWCLRPLQRMAVEIKRRNSKVKLIAFPRGATLHLEKVAGIAEIDAIGLDTAVPVSWAASTIQPRKAVQGNLDPLVLLAGGHALEREVAHIRRAFGGGAHIFNLGHGILPETPIENVISLMALIRES